MGNSLAMTTPVRLNDLPEELTLRIFLNTIEADESDIVHWFKGPFMKRHSTLLALCGTCKQFHRIASPLLVRCWTNLRKRPARSFLPYLKHLMKHPELRKEVIDISLASWN